MTLVDLQLEQQEDVLFDVASVEHAQQGSLLGVQVVSVRSLLPQVEVVCQNLAMCFLKLVNGEGAQHNVVDHQVQATDVVWQVAHPIQELEYALWEVQEAAAQLVLVNQARLAVDVLETVLTVLLQIRASAQAKKL